PLLFAYGSRTHSYTHPFPTRRSSDLVEAQKLRIPVIWKGDMESEIGKSMMKCDPNGPVALMVTKIVIDPHAGEVALGRLFSGTRSEEHTSELQSRFDLVCRLLLEKKK